MEVNTKLTPKAQRDYDLIKAAILNNDRKAYTALMQYYQDALYFMMLKMTNCPTDAEDLTIEAFGKAFRNLSQYTPEFAFSTWLFKIASNNCIDFIRRKRGFTLSLSDGQENEEGVEQVIEIRSEDRDPEEEIIRNQKAEILHEIVNKLKPHYRVLVELRYFDEYSYEEIAHEMNLPLGTVKAKLFRARDFLFNMLNDAKEMF
ncbi:MAG: sigma-70 family RNA polymerase sigma factor [Bacteroidales bacterium]|jgi:RNA polymerase sigma-70 factor (ECF subfamily)|nr:sigma-70 family RNA polymerase sigma factor [Bacteroidales bacterium]MDD2322349.1 sigma-70 family RNA polymerase sigma factor [Bacteroidales bacterium]MDD3009840.1 sigma-70 family RNA polymerase sigma factor [Bacteroidales bacterium]MDD3960945.1 sigma-70 family RNA polymerase sigma factor [Bacteroidales bacterium]MDY0285595.1 sigma-70 family RNA polymerase sigma factor [Bacteroidales bacterium]